MIHGGMSGVKSFTIALIVAASIAAVVIVDFHTRKAFEEKKNAAGRLQERVYALETENEALARDLAFMTVKNEAAIEMAENLLVYTRLSYPMRSEEIVEELASYQRAFLALLDKLREIKARRNR